DTHLLEDAAVGGAGQEPQPGDHLGAVGAEAAEVPAAGGEAADDAVEEARLLVEVVDAKGDPLADDIRGGDRVILREQFELVAEQPRHLLASGEGPEQQHILAQAGVDGQESLFLSVSRHDRLPISVYVSRTPHAPFGPASGHFSFPSCFRSFERFSASQSSNSGWRWKSGLSRNCPQARSPLRPPFPVARSRSPTRAWSTRQTKKPSASPSSRAASSRAPASPCECQARRRAHANFAPSSGKCSRSG